MSDSLQLGASFVPVGAGPGSPATGGGSCTEFLPIITQQKIAQDAEKVDNIELRAYKLGKKRWLYNECRLSLTSQSGYFPPLEILESSKQGEETIPAPINDCGVKYSLKLRKNLRLELEVYVAYDSPVQVEQEGMHLSPTLEPPIMGYKWPPVLRSHCHKGCNGAILRSIQRYGRISRRTNRKQSPEAEVEDRAKDPRYLYLSIDEASTHVGGRKFRLVAAAFEAYDETTPEGERLPNGPRKFLGSGLSLPITVLANNDAPNGPATIDLDIALSDHWLGWSLLGEPDDPHLRNNSAESLQREHFPLDSPDGPSSMLSGTASRLLLQGLPFPRGQSRAQTELQYIRERALLSTEDDEAMAYDGDAPAAKRSRTFGEPDFNSLIFSRMETAPAQLLSSGLSSSLASTFLTSGRGLTNEGSTTGMGSLESTQQHVNIDASPLRHSSVSDTNALRMLRHNSLPSHMPDLSVLQTITDPSLRQHGLPAAMPFRYNSVPFRTSLLSELQAQQTAHMDSRESMMWAGLQNSQRLTSQQSAIRQESSPGNMVSAREVGNFPWTVHNSRERVQQVQNPGLSAMAGQISNPFALHGRNSRDDQFWGTQYRAQQGRQRNSNTKDAFDTEAE